MSFPLPLPLTGSRVAIEPGAEPGMARLVRLADGVEAGHLKLEARGELLFVDALCIDEPHRSYGLGSESARLLREAAAEGGWRSLQAWAPPSLGLAVYFWSRMGLRPLHGEGPDGGILFERTLR